MRPPRSKLSPDSESAQNSVQNKSPPATGVAIEFSSVRSSLQLYLNYCVIWKFIIKLNFYLIFTKLTNNCTTFFSSIELKTKKKTVQSNWMLEVTFGQINISRNSNLNQEKGSFLESLNICSGAKSYEKWGCFTSFWKHVFFSRHTLFFFSSSMNRHWY